MWNTGEISRQEGIVVRYHQITPERYTLATLHKQFPAPSVAEMARLMGGHRSTIAREIARNSSHRHGVYRPYHAHDETNRRRSGSRRNSRFGTADWYLVVRLLREGLSPEQISGRLHLEDRLEISRESIYRFIRRDKHRGGTLFRLLRNPRNGGSGMLAPRSAAASAESVTSPSALPPSHIARRSATERWTRSSALADRHCVVTLAERVTGCVLMGKLRSRSVAATNRRVIQLIRSQAPVQDHHRRQRYRVPRLSRDRATRSSTSPHRIPRGNVAPTRTPTGSFEIISRSGRR